MTPTEKLDEIEAALKPFADDAGRYDPIENDDDDLLWSSSGGELRLKHLRSARSALPIIAELRADFARAQWNVENAQTSDDARFAEQQRLLGEISRADKKIAERRAEIAKAVEAETEACAKILDARGVSACERGMSDPDTGAFECRKLSDGECNCFEFDEAAAAIRARKGASND
jgi:hypothetical protein